MRTHSKAVSKLQLDFTDILCQSEAKLHVATERYQNLKRDYNAVLDDIKIKHRQSLRKYQILHAQQIQKKNDMMRRMWNDAEGTREMLCEMLDEMNESRRLVKFASTTAKNATSSAEKSAKRASILYTKLKLSSNLINELKDDIQDETMMVDDLKQKVNEYEDIIDWMEQEYEETCQNYQTKIDSIKAYYTAIIEKNTPRYVMKHWVKNKTRGEYVPHAMILIASFN